MSTMISEPERAQMKKLRAELADVLTDDLNSDLNIYRWVHGWRGNTEEASRRFRTYVENRKSCGLDGPDFLEHFYSHPMVSTYAPYFSFTVWQNAINATDNTVLCIQRFQNVEYTEMTKVMTCGQFLMLYFAVIEWEFRQVLRCEAETGRKSGLTLIFDLDNFSLMPYVNPNSAVVRIFGLCLGLLQDCYCELLHRVLIINGSAVLNAVLGIVKRFLNANTQHKFTVVTGKDGLLKYVHPSVLPIHYGGNRRLSQADTQLGGVHWNMDPETCTLIPRPVTADDHCIPRKFLLKPTIHQIESKGGKYEIRRHVLQAGAKIIWQFTVDAPVQFTAVRLVPGGKEVRLVPRWTLITPRLPEEGSITCTEAGEYVLQFVNPGDGWFRMKLEYHLEIEPAL